MNARLDLHHPDPAVRRRALRRVDCAWSLKDALHDDDARVRAAAALRLGATDADERWLRAAAHDPKPLVRAAAYRALGRAADPESLALLHRAARAEPAWWARRSAVTAAARAFGPRAIRVLDDALTDPFWRVRHAAVKQALRVSARHGSGVVRALLVQPPRSLPHAAALEYLRRAREGHDEPTLLPEPPPLLADDPLYDADPAVMSARLESGEPIPSTTLALLIADPHGPLREQAIARLLEAPDRAALQIALVWLEDPRVPHAQSSAMRVLDGAGALAHQLAREVMLARGHPRALTWALSWAARARALDLDKPVRNLLTHEHADVRACAGRALAAMNGARPRRPDAEGDPRGRPLDLAAAIAVLDDEDDPRLRRRAARVLGRARDLEDLRPLLRASRDADLGVRAIVSERIDALPRPALYKLSRDKDPEVRAAAFAHLDLDLAELELALEREKEPRVVELLIGLCATRGLVNEPPRHRPHLAPKDGPTRAPRRMLGHTGVELSPLIVSGAHGLPVVALRRAARRGVNTFFWEPRYAELTRFLKGKRELQVVAGSYEASPEGIARDLEEARRRLNRDVIDVFLLFWARSKARLSSEAFAALAEHKALGQIRAHGFSTHLRDLAADALDDNPWDVVMTRHSAAHRGAERFFADCAEQGVGVLSFSALSYGRLLQGNDAAAAADCYRYSLAQPGVSATLTAPRYARELDENLGVFARPWLNEAARARVLEKGARVYKKSKDLAALVRRTPTELSAERAERLKVAGTSASTAGREVLR
jgi:HEAT repeat protein